MVGTADTYYLDHAVHLMQRALEATAAPHSDATFDYGVDQPHCYTGPPGSTTREGGLTFTQRVLERLRSPHAKNRPRRRRHHQLALLTRGDYVLALDKCVRARGPRRLRRIVSSLITKSEANEGCLQRVVERLVYTIRDDPEGNSRKPLDFRPAHSNPRLPVPPLSR